MKNLLKVVVAGVLALGTLSLASAQDRGLHRGWYKHDQDRDRDRKVEVYINAGYQDGFNTGARDTYYNPYQSYLYRRAMRYGDTRYCDEFVRGYTDGYSRYHYRRHRGFSIWIRH